MFAGYVSRPNIFKLRYDAKGLSWLFPVLWAMRRGDNTLLDAMVGLFEREGLVVKSVADVAPWLQIPAGPLGRIHPTPRGRRRYRRRHVGGTQAGCARCRPGGHRQRRPDTGDRRQRRHRRYAAPNALGRHERRRGRGVLAKALKPQQTRKTDLPTIGVATVENAAAAGLAGIAVEAHTALVLDRAAVAEAADALGVFVTGIVDRAVSTLPAKPLSLMLVCGEPSGDQLGGQLMAALKTIAGDSVKITGVGGRAMAAQGLTSLFPLDDTAVMGLREVVPKIPVILRRVRDVCDVALATRPDAVVLIDSPDFTHRIAQAAEASRPHDTHH